MIGLLFAHMQRNGNTKKIQRNCFEPKKQIGNRKIQLLIDGSEEIGATSNVISPKRFKANFQILLCHLD